MYYYVNHKIDEYNYVVDVVAPGTLVFDRYNVDLQNFTVTSQNDFFIDEEVKYIEPEIEVKLYAFKYNHYTTDYQANATNIKNTKGDNVLKVEESYLINKNNVREIAQHILDYYNSTFKDEFQIILKDESLADVTEANTKFEQKLKGNISKLDIDLAGGFLADVTTIAKIEEADENG